MDVPSDVTPVIVLPWMAYHSGAEAAKSAFEVIKNQMESSGEAGEKKDKIVLATVKGDIHDIGKNIVKMILESNHLAYQLHWEAGYFIFEIDF